MAEKVEKTTQEKDEGRIPVFTVLKNGLILKNIFLNSPPALSELQSIKEASETGDKKEEKKLLVGRHPECHIVLDHPSISRFHLQITSHPSLQRISVIDLSSVHGTWVAGRKIEPQVAVEMEEGDTLRLGASTRFYKLHWVPWSQAFETEKPFIPAVEAPEEEEETSQDEIVKLPVKKENVSWTVNVSSDHPMLESLNSSSPDEVFSGMKMLMKRENLNLEGPLASLSLFDAENESPKERIPEQSQISQQWGAVGAESVSSSVPVEILSTAQAQLERNHHSPQVCCNRKNVSAAHPKLDSMNSSSPDEVLSDTKMLTKRENLNLEGPLASLGLFKAENESPKERISEQSQTSRHWAASLGAESVSSSVPVEILSAAPDQLERDHQSPQVCFNKGVLLSDNRENESPPIIRSEKQNTSSIWSRRCKSVGFLYIQTRRTKEKMDEKIDDVIKVDDQKENTDVGQCIKGEPLGKVLFEKTCQSEKENSTPLSVGLKPRKDGVGKLLIEVEELASREEKLPPKVLFEESFPSDKENITSIISGCLTSKKFSLEIEHTDLQKLSLKGIVADMDMEGDIFPTDKENLTPNPSRDSKLKRLTSRSCQGIKQDMLKRNTMRLPFQPLLENSTDKSKSLSVFHPSPRNSYSANHSQLANGNNSSSVSLSVDQVVHNLGEGKRKWNMVADTSTLIDEESRKSLKLLEGLKGTHLIIPRMVIRELDCLRRRGSRFGRANDASSILQWIEECMVKTTWWIHVQSSAESVPIAPTPPGSPQSRLSGGSVDFPASTNSVPFSACGSLMEIVSPTAEDHILECALLFKRIKEDGQLVLLSNDVALKIKAMAEGLICESAKEFRDSLVNPCSKRFMWVESTPIGPTWSSCSDDAGMKENYVYCPPAIRKTGKATEGAKGLKLILLHNSQYGQMNQVR